MIADPEISTTNRNLFGAADTREHFTGLPEHDATRGREILEKIAARIGADRRPGAKSDIPAGVTYLTQFVVHDLDFLTRDTAAGGRMLDLALIYGDGPGHDAFAYQVPAEAGARRHLLRLGRARPTASSPAWGAARDLPRASCPHLDGRATDSRSEVLVPNSFSDSNALLAQMQVLWMLLHNAVASTLAETRSTRDAFEQARRINRGIYADVVRRDVLGSWLMPRFRDRYTAPEPRLLSAAAPGYRAPREFMAGVGRMGHCLVREIYALNDAIQVAGLRNLMRHTSTGRPHDMPLTEDWLVDFARFFAIGTSQPQFARALGPHVARPFATGTGVAVDGSDDPLLLRDLVACTRGDLLSVGALIEAADRAEPGVFDGCLAGEGGGRVEALSAWLADARVGPDDAARLAADPPLTLYLMLEAEADAGGRTLGALGSVIMGETIAAQLPLADADPALAAARDAVFHGAPPASMAEVVRFLQRHFRFAEGARLHGSEFDDPPRPRPSHVFPGGTEMLDSHSTSKPPIPRIEVADFIEMGRLVAQWSADPDTRPQDVAELAEQLDGIAVLPERIRTVEFVQSTLDHLVLRLPVKEMIEESLERMADPMGEGSYPLPQFYSDYYRPGFGPVMTPLDTLLARVGDYTIAQCR